MSLPIRWIIVQHASDALRPTSTGRLTAAMLSPSVLAVYGRRGEPFDPAGLLTHPERTWLLFPSDDAIPLMGDWLRAQDGLELVMLDGTWRQASRMSHRVPIVRDLPRLRLPVQEPSGWSIRRADRTERLCTVETAIRVVALLGELDAARRMWEIMKWIEARLLYMKGRAPYPIGLDELRTRLVVPEWLRSAPAG